MGSYKRQLLIGLAFVTIAVLAGSYGMFRGTFRETVLEQARDGAREQLRTSEYSLRQAGETLSQGTAREMLLELARRGNMRLSLLNAKGEIVADTGLQPSGLTDVGSQLGTPEIEEADQRGTGYSIRYSPELHVKFLFVARKIEDLAGMDEGFLRLGKPYAPLLLRSDRARDRFFWLVGGTLLLLVPVYLFLSRRLVREVGRITREVEAIGRQEGRSSSTTLQEFVPMIRSLNRISEQTRDYLQQLSVQRDEGEAIFNGLEDGVAVLDSEGGIRRYNRAMADIVRSKQDLKGRKPIECIPSTELQEAVEEMLARQEKDAELGRSLYVTFYNQSHFEVTLLPIEFEQARAMEIILVLHDVTELKRLEQARKDFVANISHELRTPITSIKGYTETLLYSPPRDREALRSFMSIVDKNVDNLDRLVDNLINLTKAESWEEGNGQAEEVDLVQVLDAVWQVCAPLAQQKGITLNRELPDIEPYVLGNKEQLIQVVLNLLDNAIKYSPEGEQIEARIRDLGEQWLVEVEDNGPGVPPGLQSRIFERFYRAETGRSGSVSGTGLGLSICKHILQRHGGEITVESPVSGDVGGARFAFTLAKHRQLTESSGEERAHE
jgi:two-component system phosphate regulon sensor histidine kinase PhoR